MYDPEANKQELARTGVTKPIETQPWLPPHGGRLVSRLSSPEARAELSLRELHLQHVALDARAASDLLLLATGAFSPLEGFMNFDTARSVVEKICLPDGTLWSLPILLPADRTLSAGLRIGSSIVLRHRDTTLGTLKLEEKFDIPRRDWAAKVFQTVDEAHPGVAAFLKGGEVALAGRIDWTGDARTLSLDDHWLTPEQTRAAMILRGWRTVAGFQTRNPIHRAHEYVLRTGLEMLDGLLIHPLVGETRSEDVPAAVRLRCYEALVGRYLPAERVLFSVLPAWMRYAGPREAVFHAVVRKNFGCTHFLVGRDHAGVGGYYGPYEAQNLLRAVAGEGLGIEPVFFDEVFYCRRCASMASRRTCAHGPEDRLTLSGTQVRQRLRDGLSLPGEFTRPEVAALLAEAFRAGEGELSA